MSFVCSDERVIKTSPAVSLLADSAKGIWLALTRSVSEFIRFIHGMVAAGICV